MCEGNVLLSVKESDSNHDKMDTQQTYCQQVHEK